MEEKDFELVNMIGNGWWYTFDYQIDSEKVENDGADKNPFIYCIGPNTKAPNCFWGINIHHLPEQLRRELFEKMLSDKQFNESEKRYFYNDKQLMSYVDRAKYKEAGIRCYDRKKIRNAYRVKNNCVGKYLMTEGNLIRSNPEEKEIEYNLSMVPTESL